MAEQIINNDELFSSVDYTSLFDGISFSTDLQMEGTNSVEFLESLLRNDNVPEHAPTMDQFDSLEFEDLLLDFQNDNQSISDGVQPIEDANVHQNSDVINTPTAEQANESQDKIMYQMDPSAFACITGHIYVKQQPKANKRLRYESDGSRFLPDSRYHPMSINLPDLQAIPLQDNQRFGIVITIISDTYQGTFVHANDIFCRINGAKKIAYGCVFVPLDGDDIKKGEKKFPRLSIVYKKCDEYTFDLTPFDPMTMFGPTEKYTSKTKKIHGNAAKGKQFKEDYDLLSYKFVFQLALEQDNAVYLSHIACETEIIHEEKASKPSNKRSASVSIEDTSEEDSIPDARPCRPSKKIKSLPLPIVRLPVTRVSNVTDHPNDLA